MTTVSRSSGPRSVRGKKRASTNALSHGVLSLSPTLPGENRKPWQQFRDAIYRDIAPLGALEECLAGMLALQIWRYRRLANYETAIASQRLSAMNLGNSKVLENKQKLESEVADWEKTLESLHADRRLFSLVAKDDQTSVTADEAFHFYESFGMLFEEYTVDPLDEQLLLYIAATPASPEAKLDEYDLTDWKVFHLKKGVEYIASLVQHSCATVLGRVRAEIEEQINRARAQLVQLRKQLTLQEAENRELLDHA